MSAKYLLVSNPTAQSGKNRERIALAIDYFSKRGSTVEVLATLPDGRTVPAVTDALDAGKHSVVIAMGGDGTFREVAAGLCESRRRADVALGMLPTGTANDQGRSFDLDASPDALEDNVAVICAGHETKLDAGVLEQGSSFASLTQRVRFFDSAGFGLSARVLAQRNKDRRFVEHLGPLKELYRDHAVYAGAFLKTFLESYVVPDKFVVRATLDGVRHDMEGLSDLVVKATKIYAGAWVFDETSKHDDGQFELVPFRGKRDWTSKAIVDIGNSPLNEALLNQVGIEHSHALRAARMELLFERPSGSVPIAAQIDGEEWPFAPCARVTVEKQALRLIVPGHLR